MTIGFIEPMKSPVAGTTMRLGGGGGRILIIAKRKRFIGIGIDVLGVSRGGAAGVDEKCVVWYDGGNKRTRSLKIIEE